jgi:hypothetical protein
VITIWSPNSIKSDWVRAEAGRAKADGKLIPVKTPELTYADIPLPFGEMHTENVGSTDLIRAAIVAQLAKPTIPASQFWQITGLFKYQALTWIGIIGTTITLFANLSGVLDLADWARELVAHWHEWTQAFWGWVFSWIKVKVPTEWVPILSFNLFSFLLVVGINLSEWLWRGRGGAQKGKAIRRRIAVWAGGVGLYGISVFVLPLIDDYRPLSMQQHVTEVIAVLWPLLYLLLAVKDRKWVLTSSLLFLVMGILVIIVPLRANMNFLRVSILSGFQVLLIGVIAFSPLQQLTRRLVFVVLGVLTLVALSEISKLNLHQYLQPSKVSEISSPTHNLPSHAVA